MFWSLYFSTTLPSSYPSGKPTLTLLGGSARTLGKRKRKVPSVHRPNAPAMVVQAKANQLPAKKARKPRRSSTFGLAAGLGAAAAGFGAAAAGLGAAAAGVAGLGAVTPSAGLFEGAGSDMAPKLQERSNPSLRPGRCWLVVGPKRGSST